MCIKFVELLSLTPAQQVFLLAKVDLSYRLLNGSLPDALLQSGQFCITTGQIIDLPELESLIPTHEQLPPSRMKAKVGQFIASRTQVA